ncbi:MAG: shikimate kinase [Coriobacteriia bacterium]|nr:shikimate kinase [Coriobacteriia bacterium]
MSHVLLIGFMGCGKSTVGRLLALRLGRTFVDLDDRVCALAGTTVERIFAEHGEATFRRLEANALESLLREPPSVVACGGGVVVSEGNRTLLPQLGTVFYLRVDAAEALRRIGDTSSRPLLAGPGAASAARALLAERESVYAAVARVSIDTQGQSVQQVTEKIITALEKVDAEC